MHKKQANNPILITGMHNSGTTWVGKMLSIPENIFYIHEPFNLNWGEEGCHLRLTHWYTYITDENHEKYFDGFSKIVQFQYDLFDSLIGVRGPVGLIRRFREYFYYKKAKTNNYRPLIKDPIAFFSAPWIHQYFNAEVIVTVRHPAAVVSSIMKREWESPMLDLLNQELLMQDYLGKYKDEMLEAINKPDDLVFHYALLWKVIYSTLHLFKQNYPSWILVKHEDLVRKPVEKYKEIFSLLGIEHDDSQLRLHLGENRNDPRTGEEMATEWKENFTHDQVTRIRDIVGDAADIFYSDESWKISK